MIPFPADKILDEDAALAWWEQFASDCEEMAVQGSLSALTRQIVASLRAIRMEDLNRELTLTQAARLRGYSPGHVGRLVRQGKLHNAGRKHAPRIRAGDLPNRLKKLDRPKIERYDPVADARSLRSRREETPNGDS